MTNKMLQSANSSAFAICQPVRWSSLLHSYFESPCTSHRPRSHIIHAATSVTMATPTDKETNNLPRPAKVICVGDIHGQWADTDEAAIRALKPDVVLFVGDYGNEDVQVTSRIANFASNSPFHVATVFGNHDAHYTASSRKRLRYQQNMRMQPDQSLTAIAAEKANMKFKDKRNDTCKVRQQMELLQPFDVSYRCAAYENLSLSIIGGRAFSIGGPNWKHASFYREFLNVVSLPQSASKLTNAAISSPFSNLIFLSHSGPTGLGDLPNDPCGKDWGLHPGGDYGDADLRQAIESARSHGFHVSLTVFGHMHKTLQGSFGERTMMKTEVDGDGRHVMLNVAVVPRHKQADSRIKGNRERALLHNFHIVNMKADGRVEKVEEVWVSANGTIFQSSIIYDDYDPSTFNDVSQNSLRSSVENTPSPSTSSSLR